MRDATCAVGDEILAVVLYTDYRASCVELSINADLVKVVKHLKKNKFTQVLSQIIIIIIKLYLNIVKSGTAVPLTGVYID